MIIRQVWYGMVCNSSCEDVSLRGPEAPIYPAREIGAMMVVVRASGSAMAAPVIAAAVVARPAARRTRGSRRQTRGGLDVRTRSAIFLFFCFVHHAIAGGPSLIMSVDVGTESTRAAVFDRDGRIVGKGSALHATTHPQVYLRPAN
eukprot:6174243-Pleurochrysis_carterae.AAC.2